MAQRLDWRRDGRDWPNREASRFVDAGGLRWHVQRMGTGPVVWLIHGTGAATHSWRDLMPRLAEHFTVIAADLPGHGFTSAPADARQYSLAGMAALQARLRAALGVDVDLVVGHSAGAAIAAQVGLDGGWRPRGLVSLNGALLPFDGLAGLVFPPVARLMAATPIAARLFAWRSADPAAVARLITSTGSTLDARGVALYGRLVRDPGHAGAALHMMARWNLQAFERRLPGLPGRLHLLVGDRDRAVPPGDARRVAARVPGAQVGVLPGLGHLAHEERPDEVARRVHAAFDAMAAQAT